MQKLRQYIFDYLRCKEPERLVRFPHMDKPIKLMVIYESDLLERNDEIKAIRQDLLKRQIDVTMWGYAPKKEISSPILLQSRVIGLTDFNWLGKLKSEVKDELRAVHYDLLIDLTTNPVLPLRYLALYTDADFKVGLNLGEGLHDMLISMPVVAPAEGETDEEPHVDVTRLYHEIMKYLTTIKSND